MITKVFRFFKKYWLPISALVIATLMFSPSLRGFFTHDDFYFLKIANVSSWNDFINFFNPIKDIESIGVYRPLTLRVFYFLGATLFNLNPIALRIIAFLTFYVDIILVGFLVKLLTGNAKIAAFSLFLYATSVTHFGQLYYIGAYQELLLTFTFLASVIFFIKFEIESGKRIKYESLVISLLFFLLSLMSKETGVMLPAVLVLVHLYLRATKQTKLNFKRIVFSLLPYAVIASVYLAMHFIGFGVIEGDSYIWNFSITKAVNTTFWYFLWSLNLPETLVDFVGPGIHLNPNLLKYWSDQIIPIFILFVIQIILVIYAFFKSLKSKIINLKPVIILSSFWFVATILPVVFLPLHKFTYYLTLPLFGVVLTLSYLFINLKSKIYILFCIVWVAISLVSLRLTTETNWITQGLEVSERVNSFLKENQSGIGGKKIVFVDTPEDSVLPWSPTATLKTVLSGNNFFDVFYPDLSSRVSYSGEGDIEIKSRQFLGY